jgi:hypothetical protein
MFYTSTRPGINPLYFDLKCTTGKISRSDVPIIALHPDFFEYTTLATLVPSSYYSSDVSKYNSNNWNAFHCNIELSKLSIHIALKKLEEFDSIFEAFEDMSGVLKTLNTTFTNMKAGVIPDDYFESYKTIQKIENDPLSILRKKIICKCPIKYPIKYKEPSDMDTIFI